MRIKLGPLHAKRRALLDKLANKLTRRNSKAIFDASAVRKIVFLRDNNKFGDLIVSTISFREVKKAGFEVAVIAGLNNAKLIEENPYIDNIFTHEDTVFSIIRLCLGLRHHRYDLLVDLRNEIPTYKDIMLMKLLGVRHVLGFNKHKYPIYDVNLEEDFSLNQHASFRNIALVRKLGVKSHDIPMHYDIVIKKDIESKVVDYLNGLPGKQNLLINVKGDSPSRSLSIEQVASICLFVKLNHPDFNIILSGKPSDIGNIDIEGVLKTPFSDYLSAVALVKHADVVISPDTSIVHAAAAFSKPLIALYQKDKRQIYLNSLVWGPNNSNARQIVSHDYEVDSIDSDLINQELGAMISQLPER